jgi:hypothetical protein
VDACLQTRQHQRYCALGEPQGLEENRQAHDALALAIAAGALGVVAEGATTDGTAVADGLGVPHVGVNEGLRHLLMALEERALAVATGRGPTLRQGLDLRDDES